MKFMEILWKKTTPTGSSSTCHPHLRQQTSPSPSPSAGGETPPRGPVYCVTAQQRPRPCVDDLVEIIQDGGWRVDLRVVFVGWFSAMVWGDHGSQERNLNLSYLPDFYRNTLKLLTKHSNKHNPLTGGISKSHKAMTTQIRWFCTLAWLTHQTITDLFPLSGGT